jgi:hypothetical protein
MDTVTMPAREACTALGHHLRRGILRGAEQQARRNLDAIERERLAGGLNGFDRVHGRSFVSAALPRRYDFDAVVGRELGGGTRMPRHELAVEGGGDRALGKPKC